MIYTFVDDGHPEAEDFASNFAPRLRPPRMARTWRAPVLVAPWSWLLRPARKIPKASPALTAGGGSRR